MPQLVQVATPNDLRAYLHKDANLSTITGALGDDGYELPTPPRHVLVHGLHRHGPYSGSHQTIIHRKVGHPMSSALRNGDHYAKLLLIPFAGEYVRGRKAPFLVITHPQAYTKMFEVFNSLFGSKVKVAPLARQIPESLPSQAVA